MLYTVRTFYDECGIEKADVALVGIPFDSLETQRQTKYGPLFFRQALQDLEGFDIETKIDIWEKYRFSDVGNIDVVEGSWELTQERIRDTIKHIFGMNPKILPVFIGGDHSVTYGILKSMQEIINKKITVIHFDAHPDLFMEWKGYKYSHATWAYNILNDSNFELVQIGCRCISEHEYKIWKNLKKTVSRTNNPVYISFDLDVLDPAYANSVATPEPLGLTAKEVFSHLKEACRNNVIGFDIVECASRSVDNNTQFMACNVMKKILVYLWEQKKQKRL